MDEQIKEQLGLDSDKPIPADYPIPYFVHEEEINREEHHTKRWFYVWVATFIALVLTNIGWIVYESRYEDVVTETYTAETEKGGTAVANGDGSVVVNGESDLHQND